MNMAYNVDCLEYMRMLPDKAFDIAVCDPPYGNALANESGGGTGTDLDNDSIDTRPKRFSRKKRL